MRKYVIAVARCRRGLKKYGRKLDLLIRDLSIVTGGETYALAQKIYDLVTLKLQLRAIAETDRLMSVDLTDEENAALTICTCGEGSRRAAERLGVDREEILRSARRALDKCGKVAAALDFSCEPFIASFYENMIKDIDRGDFLSAFRS